RRSAVDTPMQRVLELQRSAGNQAVIAALADGAIQRDGVKAADAPVDLRLHLLDLKGISSVKVPDPTPPWLPSAGSAPAKKADHDDDALKIWNLDFDLDADDDSALGQLLAREKKERQILSGGKGDADTPLGLQLTNAAVNILANTDKGQALAKSLYLDHFSVVVDPSSGNYGVMARFTFGGK
ncbi:MAG TPA: hypothetical protein VIT43_00555, partial [Candidatus Dormibacteraeota bacterium]